MAAVQPIAEKWRDSRPKLRLVAGSLLCAALTVGAFASAATFPGRVGTATNHDLSDEWRAIALEPIAEGSRTGSRQPPTPAAQRLASALPHDRVDMDARTTREPLEQLLERQGAASADAKIAADLVRTHLSSTIRPGQRIRLTLGASAVDGRTIERLSLSPDLGTRLLIERSGGATLRAEVAREEVDTTPARFVGRLNTNVYESLRAAGVPQAQAIEYLRALGSRPGLDREVSPDDRFDLLLESRRTSTGEQQFGALLYAGIDRIGASDVQMLKWRGASGAQWIDLATIGRSSTGLALPVAGHLTSSFGMRMHPILGFLRFHRGIDIGARWGAPVTAAADGRVTASGWRGGYGRQVTIAHDGGLVTSYSHLSGLAAASGSIVRRGQLIGYVGSTGLSTGPHLHFEAFKDGRPIDPITASVATAPALSHEQLELMNSRLAQLLSIAPRRL